MRQKPDLSFWKLWNLSFGFFGVQIAYALQSANISRIFRTLGEVIKIHELIKVKFNEFKDEKKELARAIEEKTDSTLVRIIGNVAIFYKEAEKMADRKFAKGLLKA